MWARISPAIEGIAPQGGALAPLFINSKSNRLLVSCFTGKTLHRELAAVISGAPKRNGPRKSRSHALKSYTACATGYFRAL
jgi:hypothetical protein